MSGFEYFWRMTGYSSTIPDYGRFADKPLLERHTHLKTPVFIENLQVLARSQLFAYRSLA